jgi:hypothetical protein
LKVRKLPFVDQQPHALSIDPLGPARFLLESCQFPLAGPCIIHYQVRYTAPLVQIEEFEGKP